MSGCRSSDDPSSGTLARGTRSWPDCGVCNKAKTLDGLTTVSSAQGMRGVAVTGIRVAGETLRSIKTDCRPSSVHLRTAAVTESRRTPISRSTRACIISTYAHCRPLVDARPREFIARKLSFGSVNALQPPSRTPRVPQHFDPQPRTHGNAGSCLNERGHRSHVGALLRYATTAWRGASTDLAGGPDRAAAGALMAGVHGVLRWPRRHGSRRTGKMAALGARDRAARASRALAGDAAHCASARARVYRADRRPHVRVRRRS